MRRLARFLQLAGWERRVFLRALVLLPVSMVRIRRVGVRRALLAADGAGHRLPAGASHAVVARRVATLVALAARHGPFRASCLPVSVTLHRLLRERGIQSQLRVGVRKAGDRLEAHAWVERDGQALVDSQPSGERFMPFPRPIASASEAK